MQQSLEAAEMAPIIVALQERLESVRQTELERVCRRQVGFCPEQQEAIEELTRSIVNRILHGPVKVLETALDNKEPAALLRMVRRIFNLGDEPVGRPVPMIEAATVGQDDTHEEADSNSYSIQRGSGRSSSKGRQ